jgi:hypothetical protein
MSATVRKFLDLSTVHLTPEQREYGGRDGDSASWGGAIVDVRKYGFWMWVPDDPKESSRTMEERVPKNLLAVKIYARRHGCDYVLFDTDAERNRDVEAFDG